MEKIDIQNFKKYYQNNDGNGTVARVGHVNAVIDGVNNAVTRDYTLTLGLDSSSSLDKIQNFTVTDQGIELEFYQLSAILNLFGNNSYTTPIGYIQTSSPFVVVTTNQSNVIATDSVFNNVNSPLGTGALVTDTFMGSVIPVSFLTVNLDNNITTPDEHFVFVLGGDPTSFDCRVFVNMEIAVLKGSTVEYTVI